MAGRPAHASPEGLISRPPVGPFRRVRQIAGGWAKRRRTLKRRPPVGRARRTASRHSLAPRATSDHIADFFSTRREPLHQRLELRPLSQLATEIFAKLRPVGVAIIRFREFRCPLRQQAVSGILLGEPLAILFGPLEVGEFGQPSIGSDPRRIMLE